MKLKISLIALMAILFVYGDIFNNDKNIHGSWEGTYHSNKISMEFNIDNACIIKLIDRETNKTETISGTYYLDFSKHPFVISIRNIKELNYTLYGILKFVKKDLIQISSFLTKSKLNTLSFDSADLINLERSE